MGDNGSVWLPEGASTLAPVVDNLFNFVNLVSLILFILVVGAMLLFVYKYRRNHPNERPQLVHESKLMEISWIVVPTILVLLVFTWGFQAFIKISVAPPDAYEIRVKGYQWYWTFEYPEGFTTTGELHVPADRPVRLLMSSEDVLHSFFVPAFRVKHDVVPNRYTSLWFEATKTGEYQVFCTEYCGTNHSGMEARVIVHGQQEFSEWLKTGGKDYSEMTPVEIGALLYEQQQCQQCHSLDGSNMVGPTWQGLYGAQRQFVDGTSAVADENYLRTAIINPAAEVVQGYANVMPASYSNLEDAELDGLVEFIKSLE